MTGHGWIIVGYVALCVVVMAAVQGCVSSTVEQRAESAAAELQELLQETVFNAPIDETPEPSAPVETSQEQAAGAVTTPPANASGARIVRVWAQSDYLLGLETQGLETWPSWKLSNDKVVCGYICVNGKMVDKIGAHAKAKVLHNLQHGSDYHQDIKKGQTVRIHISPRRDGQGGTEPVEFVFPWADTASVEFQR